MLLMIGILSSNSQQQQGTQDAKVRSLPKTPEEQCMGYRKDDLSQQERFPTAGQRHMVDPPAGGNMTLVCCQTTAGPWNILVHYQWAPRGADRFVKMVKSGYFNDQKVPLMRCVRIFLCQFGLAGLASREWASRLEDDPNWLPEGKEHRQNSLGVKRFAR